jgi:hypothetical protein
VTGRHEAPPVASGAREATAPPWHGQHQVTVGPLEPCDDCGRVFCTCDYDYGTDDDE